MTLFLGFPIPENARKEIRVIQRHFSKQKRNLKMSPLDRLHFTVKFLGGKVSEESLEAILEEIRKHRGELKAPKVSVESLEFGFKGQIRPTVLYLKIKNTESLDSFVDKVQLLIKALNLNDVINKKDRTKHTHRVTIGRAKPVVNRRFGKEIQEIIGRINTSDMEFEPERLSFIESTLTNRGPLYKEIDGLPIIGQ